MRASPRTSHSPIAGLRRLLRPGEAEASVGIDGVAALDDKRRCSRRLFIARFTPR
jgi:hypothetical protein